MNIYTKEFVTVAKCLVTKEDVFRSEWNKTKQCEEDSLVDVLIDKVATWCKKNSNASSVIGQITLPNGDVFPRDNALFESKNLFYQRAQAFRRMAKRRSEASETDKAINPRTRYEDRLMYFCNIVLILANKGAEPYDGNAVMQVFNCDNTLILHASRFEPQARELFLYLSGPVLKLRKENVLFDEKGMVRSSLASQLLFGSDDEKRKLTWAKRKAWPTAPFHGEVTQGCAAAIVREAKHLPLMSYYLEDALFFTSRKEILFLLKTITRSVSIESESGDVKVVLDPLVSSILKRTEEVIFEQCERSESTSLDTLSLLGYLARMASEKDLCGNGVFFDVGDIDTDEIKDRLHIMEPAHKENVDAAIREGVVALLEALSDETAGSRGTNLLCKVGSTGYQFIVKPLRLSLLAFDIARQYNAKPSILCEELFGTLRRFSGIRSVGSGDYVTVAAEYDGLVILSSAVFLQLREDHRTACMEYLCEQAGDFSVGNRHRQIAAIYSLTAVLYERIPMTYQMRQKIFCAAFGHTTYALQQREWAYIRKNRYYINEVQRAFERAAESEMMGNRRFLIHQPYYFFLFHEVCGGYNTGEVTVDRSPACLKRAAYYYRNRSWEMNTHFSEKEEKDLCELGKGLNMWVNSSAKAASFESQVGMVYAVQAFLYTVSNLCYRHIPVPQNLNRNTLRHLMFFADAFLRRHNKAYWAQQQNHLVPQSVKEEGSHFLLCGALRLTSVMKANEFPAVFAMNEEMKAEYVRHLSAESGRFRFLLARMLAFSDFFDDASKAQIPEIHLFETLSNSCFLKYDDISLEAIKANPHDPSKWYHSYWLAQKRGDGR